MSFKFGQEDIADCATGPLGSGKKQIAWSEECRTGEEMEMVSICYYF